MVHQVRAVVQHRLDAAEVVRAAALDHVAGQRPRAAGKADQRHPAAQLGADLRDRIEHVLQGTQIRHLQRHHLFFIAQRTLELRPLAFDKIQAQTHRIGHRQDVGKQDRRIQRVTVERLQRDFGGVIRILGQTEEGTGALARRAVFRQITTGLAHQPQRRVIGRLAQQGAQESIVLERGELWHGRQSEAEVSCYYPQSVS